MWLQEQQKSTNGFKKATTMKPYNMDSLVVDPTNAQLQFAMMVTERLSTLEAKNDALMDKVACLEQQVASQQETLNVLPSE